MENGIWIRRWQKTTTFRLYTFVDALLGIMTGKEGRVGTGPTPTHKN